MSIAEHEDILVLRNDGDYLELHEDDSITLIDCDGEEYSGEVYLIDPFNITLIDESEEKTEIRVNSIEDWDNYKEREE